MIDLRKIEYFVKVVELRSLTHAASVLGVAQSALSKNLRDLEAEVGGQLLHRTGRGVMPTDLAIRILPRARGLLEQAEQLDEEMRSSQLAPCGQVTFGILAGISPLFLTPLLLRLHERFPAIEMRVLEGLSDHIDEWLISGRIDIGVHYRTRRAIPDEEVLFSSDLFLIAAPGDPMVAHREIPLSALNGIPMVAPGLPNSLRATLDRLCQQGEVKLNVVYELDNVPTIKELVARGGCYTVFPLHATLLELQAAKLQASRIVSPVAGRQVLLSTTTQRPLTRAGREVIRMAREVAAEVNHALQSWHGRPSV